MRLAPTLLALLLAAGPGAAAEGDFVRLRGTIASLAGGVLGVSTREGERAEVRLLPGFIIAGVEPVPGRRIAVGDYVGIGSLPEPAGPDRALEVLVFPDGMEGTGEGSFDWDLVPGSIMTNARVSKVTQAPDGRLVTLAFAGETKTVRVPPDVPVVTFVASDLPDLAPGRRVFVPAMEDADGGLESDFVAVETGGTPPPM